jgi:hypothetical protein
MVTIRAIVPTGVTRPGVVGEGGANDASVARAIVDRRIIARRISPVIGGSDAAVIAVVVNWRVAAIVSIAGIAVVSIAWTISICARCYAADHGCSD